MSRREFSTAVKAAAFKRVETCVSCGKQFERAYRISRARAAKPQYCSPSCHSTTRALIAKRGVEMRFWDLVNITFENECWLWKGRVNPSGYGLFDVNRRPEIASRLAYEFVTGTDLGTDFACHSCDNPPCCNPAHLFRGSQADNMADAASKGRTNRKPWAIGSTVPTSKLNEGAVRRIRLSHDTNKQLAAAFGVSATAIYLIRKRKNWGWLHD